MISKASKVSKTENCCEHADVEGWYPLLLRNLASRGSFGVLQASGLENSRATAAANFWLRTINQCCYWFSILLVAEMRLCYDINGALSNGHNWSISACVDSMALPF
jgi:hypothetical protein